MPKFGDSSLQKLSTCHPDLQRLFNVVVETYDCTVLCGYRDKDAQEEAYRTGKSDKHFPDGNHNKLPSKAVDVVPYPINWADRKKFYHFGGYVQGIAQQMGIKIRWGGDWNMNMDLDDQKLFDLPHFELLDDK